MSQKTWQVIFSALLMVSMLFGAVAPSAVKAETAVAQGLQPTIGAELEAQMKTSSEVSYWIMFRDVPDLSEAYKIKDWAARGQYVYDKLQESAKVSQANVQTYLNAQGVSFKSYWINNSILVEKSSTKTISGLMAFSEIDSMQARKNFILYEPETRGTEDAGAKAIEPNISHVNADDVWNLGYTGEGIVVANIDTGVRYTHQALAPHYRGNLGGGIFDNNYNWYDPYGDHPTAPADDNGHGSHTMGTMVGDDGAANQIGMAPGAKFIACRGCNTSSCTDAALLGCAEFIAAPTDLTGANADPSKRPNVVNNSWGGCETSYDPWYRTVVDAWQAAGVYPVFSNGNASNCSYPEPPGLNTVGNPARYGNVTGVGSSGQTDGQYATHSNWGPTDNLDAINPVTGFENLKPQVIAPGVNIRSSTNGSDTQYQGGWSGTSMSAPHVTGLIALIWSAAPCLIGDYATTETLIEQTATHIVYDDGSPLTPTNYPNFATGWGEIDALAAVQEALTRCGSSTLQGVVSDSATSAPLAGAKVHIYDGVSVDRTLTTNASGQYSTSIFPGTYSVSAAAYGYYSSTVTNVVVGDAETKIQNFALAAMPAADISGTVTDNSGHGYPLAAKIEVTAPGFSLVFYNDEFDGTYEATLLDGQTYHFKVTAVLAGYNTLEQDILVEDGDVINFGLLVNISTCNAPGYAMAYGTPVLSQNFDTGITPPALPAGWTNTVVSGTDVDNYWSTYAGRRYPSGAAFSSPNLLLYRSYSINSGNSARLTIGDMSITAGTAFLFQMYHDTGYSSSADKIQVQVSTDSGTTWVNVGPEFLRYSATAGWSLKNVDLGAYAGQTIRLGILATSAYGNDIHLDNLQVAAVECQAQNGGMLGGYVLDANTGLGLNDATVSGGTAPVTSFEVADAPYGDGLFYTFASTGNVVFSAAKAGYATETQTIAIVTHTLQVQNFELDASWLEAVPPQVVATLTVGTTGAGAVDLHNLGGLASTFEISEKAVRVKAADVLVVRHDTTAATAMESSLTSLGYTFDGVTDAQFQALTNDQLLEYSVVFFAGTPGTAAGSVNEAKLVSYLDAGGNLFVADNDLGYYLKTTAFYTTYLQSTYVADDGGAILNGEDIMAGFPTLDITADPYPDSFTVNAEGTRIFKYSTSSNAGGVFVDRLGYKVIYLSFDYQYIVPDANEPAVIDVVMNTLGLVDIPWLTEAPLTGTVPALGTQTIALGFDATTYTQPEVLKAQLKVKNNSPYGALYVPVTLNLVAPPTYGELAGVVTGQEVCAQPGAPLLGAEVEITNSLGAVTKIYTAADGSYSYWVPAGVYTLTVANAGFVTTTANLTVTAQATTTRNFDLVLDAPCLSLNPSTPIEVTLQLGQTTTRPVTVNNTGVAAGSYEIFEIPTFGKVELDGKGSTNRSQGVIEGRGVSSLGAVESKPADPLNTPKDAVALTLDDGSAEDSVGLTNGGQFLWLNRFSPPAGQFPFQLTEVDAIFGTSIAVGDQMQLVVYLDNDTDPTNGATLLYTETFSAATADLTTWNTFTLANPVVISTPGDVLIGFINRSGVSGTLDYPAGEDQTASQQRSWVGIWTTDPPANPTLPPDSSFDVIDNLAATLAGNWMIRGIGQTGGGDVLWLNENPVTATVTVGGSQVVTIGFDAGQVTQPGTYTALLKFSWGYPALDLPVQMNVTAPATYSHLSGVANGLLECDLPGAPLPGTTVELWSNDAVPALVMTVATGLDGAYDLWVTPGTYDIKFIHTNYVTNTVQDVVLAPSATVTQGASLRLLAPCVTVVPTTLTANVLVGATTTQTLNIFNTGAADATFNVLEGAALPFLDLILDGSFELGDDVSSPWDQYSLNFTTPLCTSASCGGVGGGTGPNTGTWWAWFGGNATGDTGYVSQTLVIPPGPAELTFHAEQAVCGTSGASNYLRVLIDSTEIWRTDGNDAACGTVGYRLITLDVTSFADGGSHVLKFDSVTVGSGNFFVDDVSLNITPDVPWLSEDLVSGTIGANTGHQVIHVTFDSTGLAVGTYQASLDVRSAAGKLLGLNGSAKVPVTMNVINEVKIFLPIISK